MPITVHQHTLPNGLTIIAELDSAAHTTAAGFFVKTGARDEATPLMGVSHFLEHMMFKGTAQLSADSLNRAFDDLGARNNAYTSNELTCFYASVLPEHLLEVVELLGAMMRPALRQADFDTEKGVILEEIAMYKDNPFWVLYEASIEAHFGRHPLSHRVLGTTESITALKRDEMQGYFDQRYSADNTVVAVTGRADFDRVVSSVERACSSWTRTRAGRDTQRPPVVGGTFELRDSKINRAYLLGLAEGPAISDDRRYAAALLAQILGAPDNSRLYWSLVETGIAEDSQASFDPHDGVGQYYVFASGDPARADEIWRIISKEIAGLVDSLTEDDLVRLRNKALTAATLNGERPGDRMHRLGRVWTYMGRYQSLEAELEKIGAVTLDDLRACARDFPLAPKTVGRLVPGN